MANRIFLKDYKPSYFSIPKVKLFLNIFGGHTLVSAELQVQKNSNKPQVLQLNCIDLELQSVAINGTEVEARICNETLDLTIEDDEVVISTKCLIDPSKNTALLGLYSSGNLYCTQCEAEGFRRITPFLDRPDILSEYRVTIEADKQKYPILLSNGVVYGKYETVGRHSVTWHDPFLKPCYLFAVVAGNLSCQTDSFTTLSGKTVALELYTEPQNSDKCVYALNALKRAMKWDEQVYGREYDSDLFMIVAVDDFNMGAMENKGLNIFNSQAILADSEITTDDRFLQIEGIVAHEYFHNWSGNRVTCRDWFQLSLKEGFTVMRDGQFSEDENDPAIKRIEDVQQLKTYQFAEDSSPLAHPVRPDSYAEIDNFYTLTVYNKGAEVVRMVQQFLGEQNFRKGCDLYFESFDQQAVTVEDFISCMSQFSKVNFDQFMNWYRVAGTPELIVKHSYESEQLIVDLEQKPPSILVENSGDVPLFDIPIKIALLNSKGDRVPLHCRNLKLSGDAEATFVLNTKKQSLCFSQITADVAISIMRGFSAPVICHTDFTNTQRQVIMQYDDDAVASYDAATELAVAAVIDCYLVPENKLVHNLSFLKFCEAVCYLLEHSNKTKALTAKLLMPITLLYAVQRLNKFCGCDVIKLGSIVEDFYGQLAQYLTIDTILEVLKEIPKTEFYSPTIEQISQRKLRNNLLFLLGYFDSPRVVQILSEHWRQATNMTDKLAVLRIGLHHNLPIVEQYLAQFYNAYKDQPLVLTNYFAIQASSKNATIESIQQLLNHPQFSWSNPNKLYAVLQSFSQNLTLFHRQGVESYQLYSNAILKIDTINPNVAARLARNLSQYKWLDSDRAGLLLQHIEKLSKTKMSKNTSEVIANILQKK